MRKTAVLLIISFLFLSSPYCLAEEKSATETKAPDTEKTTAKAGDIKRLLDLTTTESFIRAWSEGFLKIFSGMAAAGGTEEQKKEIAMISNTVSEVMTAEYPKLAEKLTAVYDKYYTHEEIEELIAFYQSPVGQKTIKILPALTTESMKLGMEWGKSLMPLIEKRLKEQGLLEKKP